MQQGPCLPHCKSPLVAVLAYLCLTYTAACVGYLVLTRSMGTPFADSLTVEQRAIKAASARARGRAFGQSVGAAALLMAFWTPIR